MCREIPQPHGLQVECYFVRSCPSRRCYRFNGPDGEICELFCKSSGHFACGGRGHCRPKKREVRVSRGFIHQINLSRWGQVSFDLDQACPTGICSQSSPSLQCCAEGFRIAVVFELRVVRVSANYTARGRRRGLQVGNLYRSLRRRLEAADDSKKAFRINSKPTMRAAN